MRAVGRLHSGMARPPRIPVWLVPDQPVIYFVTFCVAQRRQVLDNEESFAAIAAFCRDCPTWQTLAAMVMPDHLHALIAPLNREAAVTQYTAGLKRYVRRSLGATWTWQEGVFDRLLRRDEFAATKWIYMRENPVRGGLVSRWEDWPYFIGYTGPLRPQSE